jgi:hypothetical protein
MGIVKAEALVDFRIGPELRTFPEFDPDGECGVERLFRRRAAGEAVGPIIGRKKRRVTLLDVCCLSMHRKNIGVLHEM